jgi:hypothetical protein
LGASGIAALCKEMADEWWEKYLAAGRITPELEVERERIMRGMLQPRQK